MKLILLLLHHLEPKAAINTMFTAQIANTIMVMAMTTETAAPSGLLQLIWLASPALPVGGFSYSEGLESLINTAQPATELIASRWLLDHLQLSLARSDLVVVAEAIAAWRRQDMPHIHTLNNWVLQTRESAEFRLQTEQMGRSMVQWLHNQQQQQYQRQEPAVQSAIAATQTATKSNQTTFFSAPLWGNFSTLQPGADNPAVDLISQPTYPVAFALAAAAVDAPIRDCLLAFTFGWAENMVQAAVKAIPLGQNAGQRILAALAQAIPGAVDAALVRADAPGSKRQAFAPMLAIVSAQHEVQYSRLFRS